MVQQPVVAVAAHDMFAGIARDLFRARVPIHDPPVLAHEVHPVVNAFEDELMDVVNIVIHEAFPPRRNPACAAEFSMTMYVIIRQMFPTGRFGVTFSP